MNAKETQIKINATLRKYESQSDSPCKINAVMISPAEGDEHALVKFWVCRAIQIGKHLIQRESSWMDLSGRMVTVLELSDYIPDEKYIYGVKLVWENNHAGEPCQFIIEAIAKKRRVDIVILETGKEINIGDDGTVQMS